MASRWRILFSTIAILGFGWVVAVHPQDVSDIASMARDLKKTLRDVDDRLKRLEQLVKDLPGASKKSKSTSRNGAVPPADEEAAADRATAQQLYLRGRIEEDSQQDARALELFAKACELDPTNDSAFLHRAFVNFRIGRVDDAFSDVNRSLKIQPDNSRAFAFRAKLYRTTKDYNHAMEDLSQALLRDQNNVEYLSAQASIEEERGNFPRAADLYSSALQFDRQSTELHLKRAAVLNAAGNQEGAMQECNRVIALKPREADGYACRADTQVRVGQLSAAANDLNQAILLKPDSMQALRLLPVVKQLMEMKEAAERLASAAVPNPLPMVTPPPPPVTVAQAMPPPPIAPVPQPEAAPKPGEEELKRLTANRPNTNQPPPAPQPTPVQTSPAQPAAQPAPRREEMRRTQQNASFPQASRTAPMVLPAPLAPPPVEKPLESAKVSDLLQTARKYLDQGVFALAILKLNEAIQLDASAAVLYNARGYAYLRTRAITSAINDFSKAIEIRPVYANAFWNRSAARRLMGDEQGATEDAREARRLGWAVDTSATWKLKASR